MKEKFSFEGISFLKKTKENMFTQLQIVLMKTQIYAEVSEEEILN